TVMGWHMSRGACSGLAVDTYERNITIAAVKYLVFKKLKTHRHLDDEMWFYTSHDEAPLLGGFASPV
ncbi:hypothetical protein FIBSPDRAFT_849963, partial [Athelia psychrophila]